MLVYYSGKLNPKILFLCRAMPPKRRMARTQEADLAAQLNEIRQMMLAQQQEIGGLRAQLAQQNQGPPNVGVPPAPVNQPAAPEIPDADPVIPENPMAAEIPVMVEPLAVPVIIALLLLHDFLEEERMNDYVTCLI